MNLTCVRFVGTLLRCGRISNSFKGTAGHTSAVDAVSRWILSCVVHRNSLSVSVRTVACIPGCRFYSNNGDQRYAGKALKVAFFLEDEDWALKAMEAAGLIGSEEGNSSSVLFLPNPGDGSITRLLLEMTPSTVVTWEPREAFYNHLQTISGEFHGRHINFELPFSRQRDFSRILSDRRLYNLNKDQSVKVFGDILEFDTYIPKLLLSFFSNEGLYCLGNIPQFLLMTGLEYRLMSEPEFIWSQKSYQRTAFYKVFFDTKHILSIPVGAFNRRVFHKSEKFSITYDRDNMYLVELRLQKKWLATASKSDGVGILRLIKAVNFKRGQRVIPSMEKWCPDIGLSLLSLGIGMMEKIKDVPIELWPDIYKELVRNKHYPYSPMKQILEGKEASHSTAKQLLVEDDIDESAMPVTNAADS